MRETNKFPYTFDGLMSLVALLRGKNGCPWDKEQTQRSMTRYVLEECYELIEAIEIGNDTETLEELGDMLFHMAFQIHLKKEQHRADETHVFKTVIEKLIHRHPHVFGNDKVSGAAHVADRWQEIKKREKSNSRTSILSGVPREMPALSHAQTVQERASSIGFDWEKVEDVITKIAEELEEFEHADTQTEMESEIGDILFSIVNFSRWMGLDAEMALRGANTRFRNRFQDMENTAHEQKISLDQIPLDQKEILWQDSKRRVG